MAKKKKAAKKKAAKPKRKRKEEERASGEATGDSPRFIDWDRFSLRSPKTGPWLLMATGFALFVMGLPYTVASTLGISGDSFLAELLFDRPLALLGLMAITVGYFWWGLVLLRRLKRRRDSRFIDLDERRRTPFKGVSDIVHELEKLRRNQESVDYDKIRRMVESAVDREQASRLAAFDSFVGYFKNVVRTLEEKAAVADEKASMLLDKGTAYSRWGIVFYVFSIVVWQIVAWAGGFRVELVYGVVSCSVLFAFIEFLSAWFLRQYRHFVDTSTYLIKVKSMFDRYLLAYQVITDEDVPAKLKPKEAVSTILQMLGADIKWPDTHILKRGDISFAREAMEAMSGLAKNLRGDDAKSTP